jgi:hypothetical protein
MAGDVIIEETAIVHEGVLKIEEWWMGDWVQWDGGIWVVVACCRW